MHHILETVPFDMCNDYSKTCLKRPLLKMGFQNQLSRNAGQKYCRMLREHSVVLSICIKLTHGFKTFLSSIFELPLKTGFTVSHNYSIKTAVQNGLDFVLCAIKVSKTAKVRNRYNQVPHLVQDTTWENDKNTRKHHIQESQEVSPFPADDQKAAMNRQEGMTNTKHKQQKGFRYF